LFLTSGIDCSNPTLFIHSPAGRDFFRSAVSTPKCNSDA